MTQRGLAHRIPTIPLLQHITVHRLWWWSVVYPHTFSTDVNSVERGVAPRVSRRWQRVRSTSAFTREASITTLGAWCAPYVRGIILRRHLCMTRAFVPVEHVPWHAHPPSHSTVARCCCTPRRRGRPGLTMRPGTTASSAFGCPPSSIAVWSTRCRLRARGSWIRRRRSHPSPWSRHWR
jgi:hypothetical protein